jgi:hypothetical protein
LGFTPLLAGGITYQQHKWDQEARYSLLVSISTPAEEVRLYTAIANEIGITIPV